MHSKHIDIVKKFLINLGYPSESIIRPASGAHEGQDSNISLPDLLVVDAKTSDVLAVVGFLEANSARQVDSEGVLLQSYTRANHLAVEQFIISFSKPSAKNKSPIRFYQLSHNSQSFDKIDFTELPAYHDLLINHHLSKAQASRIVTQKTHQNILNYTIIFASLFIFLVISDIFLDRLLDMSYLNVQRSLLIAAAALILLLPQIFPSQDEDDQP